MFIWTQLLITHELTHTAQFSEVSERAASLRRLLGTFFLPNIYAPSWLIEGYAVDMESQPVDLESTDETFPQGRLNDGIYPSIVGAKAHTQSLASLAYITSDLPEIFPTNYKYVYGANFA